MIEELKHHCIILGKYGFTLPYLYQIEANANRTKSIAEILNFISIQNEVYIIKYCSELEEYILGLHKKEEDANIEWYNNFGSLLYDQGLLGNFNSFQGLIKSMEKMYQHRIDEHTYSKNIDTLKWE